MRVKYQIVMEVEIDEDRNVELAIDSALCEYGINVVNITATESDAN